MRLFLQLAAGVLAGALLTPVAADDRDALTLQVAEQHALSRENIQRLAHARLAEAQGAVRRAAIWSNPELVVSRESVDLGDTTQREGSYWLYQELDLSGERSLRVDAAQRDSDAVTHGLEAWRRDIAMEVQEAFFTVLHQQQRLVRIHHWRAGLTTVLEQVRKQYQAQQAAAYDVVRLERAAAAMDSLATTTRAARARAHARLASLMGEPDQAITMALAGTLLPNAPPPLEVCLDRLPELPRLQRLVTQAGASRLAAQAEGRAAIPDVTLGLGYRELREYGRRFDGNLVSLGVHIPLFDRNQGARDSARAATQAQEAQYRLTLAELQGQVRGRWQALHVLRQSADQFEHDNARSTRALIQAAEAGYSGAEIGVLTLVDAYRDALDADLGLLQLQAQARTASIQLQRLIPEGSDD